MLTRSVLAQLKRLKQGSSIDHDFSVFWVPRKTLLANSILEEAGILGDINVGQFELFFQSVENDLLSLELDESFSDLYLVRIHRPENVSLNLPLINPQAKDPTCIHTSALALMTIQEDHGLFPRLLGKGDNASRLIKILAKMREEHTATNGATVNGVPKKSSMPSSDIDSLIVIDRETDSASALLTQLTYEGLIDESFHINHSHVELDTSITGTAPQPTDQQSQSQPQSHKRKVKLDGTDKLYASLRDANFAIVGNLLNRVARRLQSDYEERHGQKSVGELRDFVSKLPGYQAEHQSLKIHTSLAEDILKQTRSETFRKVLEIQQNLVAGADPSTVNEILEDLIARDAPLATVLRLLCLESVTAGGLRQKEYDNLRRQIVQAYGYQHMLTLDALEKMHLLQPKAGTGGAFSIPGATAGITPGQFTNYSAIRRPLNLIMDDVSEQDPSDIAYVYSGYAPLSVRLVQCILQKPYLNKLRAAASTTPSIASAPATDASQGWRGFEDILRNVKGKTVDETQSTSDKASRAKQVLEGRGGKKTTIVFFLGGVTFAEIAALRFVARQEEERRRIVICTTSVLSGEKMVRSAMKMGDVVH